MKNLEKKNRVIISLIFSALTIFSCGCISFSESLDTVDGHWIDIIDMQGRTVRIPENVDRIVAIEAGALRYAVYSGGADKVVGVEDTEFPDANGNFSPKPYSYAHPELAYLPSVGPIHGGESELIAAVMPDVIFWSYASAEEADVLQQQTGVPVVCIVYGNLISEWNTMCEALQLYGDVLGTQDRANALITYIEDIKKDLSLRTSNISEQEMPTAYIGGVAHRGAHSIDSTNPQYEPFELINVNNVAKDIEGTSQNIDKEIILIWDPEFIFIDESSYSVNIFDDLNSDFFNGINAIQNNNVYGVLPYNWYTSNWATVFVNAYYIGSILYPDEFSDIDIIDKADEIYTMFVGAPVYDDMLGYYEGLTRLSHHLN